MEFLILGLIIANVIVFLIPNVVDFSNGARSSYDAFLRLGWNSADDIRDGDFYRLISSMFLHADVFHLLVNMYSLWVIGPTVASIYGVPAFAIIYLVSGIGGSLTSTIFNPRVPSVGASGAIFGLVGSLLTYAVITQQIALISNIIFIILINVLIGVSNRGRIDNLGHMGGLVTGVFTGLIVILVTTFLLV